MAGDAVFTPVQEPETKQMAGGAGSVPAGLREPHEEYQYLDLVREVIENGVTRGDRTGTGTRALFGKRMQFDLRTTSKDPRFPMSPADLFRSFRS